MAADERACVIYEAPSRVPETLADLAEAAGGERRAAVCRELTKPHEEAVRARWPIW
jgi:16S rRNA (cytidine1402-2'-O)-methyltransferase